MVGHHSAGKFHTIEDKKPQCTTARAYTRTVQDTLKRMPDEASTRFIAALEPEVRQRFDLDRNLDEQISIAVERLRAVQSQRPRIRVALEELATHVATQLQPDESLSAQLDRLYLDDLYLALGCARGDRDALQVFESTYGSDVVRAVAKVGARGHAPEDLEQRVREKLFVADGDRPPRIAAYSGRGSLRGWVRVTSVRAVLDVVRWNDETKHKVDMDRDVLEAMPGAAADPELDVLRRAHGEGLVEAMREAFATLTPRQRNLLRQRFLHGLSTEKIARLYGVHRATAFRWLESARVELFDGTRRLLRERLGVSGRELESFIAVMRSRIDVSVGGLLQHELEQE